MILLGKIWKTHHLPMISPSGNDAWVSFFSAAVSGSMFWTLICLLLKPKHRGLFFQSKASNLHEKNEEY
jgi:hypothetical protein